VKRPGFPAFWRAFFAGRSQPKVEVAPKAKRISGPHGDHWHTAEGQAALTVTLGPRCANGCGAVLAGEATLFPPRGVCGRCQAHAQGNAAPPLVAEDGPPNAA